MSLPANQQRTLEKIEGRLTGSDPDLTSLFVIFSRLARDEAMPRIEDVKVRPVADRVKLLTSRSRRIFRRPAARVRALLLLPAALSAMVCAVVIAAGFPGAQRHTPAVKPPAGRELVVKSTRLCRLGLIRMPVLAC
ncbi:MAG TPA: hypothetical protein DHU96_13960 [Actinobacteria bacterium]|nr:hypothetical protein [Actinomycetota bacterium]